MKIILFNKMGVRTEATVESASKELEFTETFQDVIYKVKYVKQFHDAKKRPVYSEESREAIDNK